jgi:ADP-ribose pyrophosphatase
VVDKLADFDINDHEVLSTEQAFDGRVVKVFIDKVRLPDGRTATWERVKHPGAVGMVPLTDEGDILMVKQYRQAVRGVLLEIPAGKLDSGESPEDTAKRELVEEVGMKAADWIPLAEFYNSPGYSDERFYLYLARRLSPEAGETEPDEFLEVVSIPLEGALDLVADGSIRDAKSIIGITLARSFLAGDSSPFTGGDGS